MLLKQIHLEGIKSGKIRFAFRRWKNAAVKKGSVLKTSIGLVKVVNISEIEENKKAGWTSNQPDLKTTKNSLNHYVIQKMKTYTK